MLSKSSLTKWLSGEWQPMKEKGGRGIIMFAVTINFYVCVGILFLVYCSVFKTTNEISSVVSVISVVSHKIIPTFLIN